MQFSSADLWPESLLYWRRMSSQDISEYIETTPAEKRLVLIVWGILESHGPLLPIAHDSHFAALAADSVAQQLTTIHGIRPIVFDGWKDVGSRSATWEFPGAIGFHESHVPVVQEIWEQTLNRMVREGFTNFFVVNGDGGNWLNHWYGLCWNSEVIRHLIKQHAIRFDGSNWDQLENAASAAYLHGGAHSHALATWACKYAPDSIRLSALRHGMRAPDENRMEEIENHQKFLEDIPYRQQDWSTFPGQHRLRSVTEFTYAEYRKLLYAEDGSPLQNGGIAADYSAKIRYLTERICTLMQQ